MDTSEQTDGKPREVGRKRKWSAEERQTIVRASLKRGVTVGAVARMYGVNPSQIYGWRKQARQTAQEQKAGRLIPVEVMEAVEASETEPSPGCSVVIEAQCMRITITGDLNAAAVRTIVECLAR
jgi:transposase-like protein